MCSRCLDLALRVFAGVLLALGSEVSARDLVVCADPDFLPYSNVERGGFENRVVELVAAVSGDRVLYRWQPLRRGVVRKTLGAGACDVLAGVPVGMPGVATTLPYYRSGYVFVSRRAWGPAIAGLDDPRLRNASIGVELPGADMAATPPALALARRGIVANVTGFPLYGTEPAAQRMIAAIDRGELDVAVAWGPQIGYFAARAKTSVLVAFVSGPESMPGMAFDIALAVREDDAELRARLDRAIADQQLQIDRALAEYDVPVMALPAAVATAP